MSKQITQSETISSRYFTWKLRRREGVYFADGRSCTPSLGRHSLGTRSREEALRALVELDLTKAVEHGLAEPSALQGSDLDPLSLEEGRRLYLEHAGRAPVVGGVRPASLKRYRAVLDKFMEFAVGRGLTAWNQVTDQTLQDYAAVLQDKGYHYRTQYLELTTLKQTIGWLVRAKHLPSGRSIELRLRKPEGTDTYCWRPEEVRAMLEFCRASNDLAWLGDVLLALAMTGLRISELASLRWRDVDLRNRTIQLVDESTRGGDRQLATVRTTKGRRGRTFPIQDDLLPVLSDMGRHKDGYIFHGPLGGRIKADTVRRILIREVLFPLADRFPTAEGDIGFIHGRLHSFRHFFCSMCANRGVGQQVVRRWLGHKESRMVDHYYHLHDDEARRQMQRLRLFGEADGNGAVGQ
ncbi:site-specific tyrosine recombinase XerC [Planctomycetes bacterium Pan216]|uniref:Site-specific tyrosine recombinase XerC n=1 Tax=Kolteria novifilia TaxID=2527975 RepID=A0A518AZ06_9BACT|nr:site-specific tyrosine recombinase XerC [Planctomycetes bacterium Pan216]